MLTDSSLFELITKSEARDVWHIYLDKGMYDVALRYAKVSKTLCLQRSCLSRSFQTATQRDQVLIAQADRFFKDGRYIQSAQCYAQCSASFEEVTLNFIDAGERDALRYYLVARLERTKKTVWLPIAARIAQFS